MAQIGADTEQLRAVVNAFRQGSNTLTTELQRAQQAMQSLQGSPWAGRHRQQAEAIWEQVQSKLLATIATLETLTSRTEQFTNNLEEAGRSFGDGNIVSGNHATEAKHDDGATSKTRKETNTSYNISLFLSELTNDLSRDMHLLNTAVMAADMLKLDNALIRTSRSLLRLAPALQAVSVVSTAWHSFEKNKIIYEGQSNADLKITAATVTDTIIKEGISTIMTAKGASFGATIGASFGATIGASFGPVGALVGVSVGGVMGWGVGGYMGSLAGEYIADWITSNPEYKQFVGDTVDKTVEFVDNAGKAVSDTLEQVKRYGNEFMDNARDLANKVEDRLKEGVNWVVGPFRPRLALFGG